MWPIRAHQCCRARGQEIEGSWGYKGDILLGVAHEYRGGKKEERQMKGLCDFTDLNRSISHAEY